MMSEMFDFARALVPSSLCEIQPAATNPSSVLRFDRFYGGTVDGDTRCTF